MGPTIPVREKLSSAHVVHYNDDGGGGGGGGAGDQQVRETRSRLFFARNYSTNSADTDARKLQPNCDIIAESCTHYTGTIV